MPSHDEMRDFIKANNDFLGTILSDILGYLPATMQQELAEDPVAELALDPDAIKAKMADYMEFALSKCMDHRGISAGRSVQHYIAWMFLLDDAEGVAFALDDSNYANYGAPVLAYVAEKYNIHLTLDAAEMVMFNRMAQGEACDPEAAPCGCNS